MDIDVDARVIEAAEQQERVREQGQDDSWLNQFRAYQQQQGQGQGQEQVQAQEQEHQHKASSSSARFTETFSSSRTQIDPPSSWSFDSSPSHTLLRLDHASSSSPSPSSPSSPSSHDRDNVDLGNSPSSPLSSSHSTLHPPRLSSSIRPKSKPIPIVLSHKGNSRSLTRHSPYPPVSSLRSTSSTMTPSTSARHTLPPSAHATPPSLSAAAAARLTSPTPSMSSSNRRRQAPLFPNSPRQDRDHVPATLTPTQTAAIPYSPFRSAYSHAPRPPRQVGVPITPRTASHLAHHPYRPPPSASAPSKLPDPAYPITGPYYLVPSPTRRNAKGEPEMDVVPAVPTAAAILHLKANAGKFWNAPESADIVLSIPAARDAVIPRQRMSDGAEGMKVPEPSRQECNGTIPTINFYAHMSYLTARSALLRRVLATPNPVDPKGVKFLPTDRESHLNLWIPVPDTRSFALLLHWIYWGDEKALDVGLKDGTANWKGLVANVQYLEMDSETKFAVGIWWKKWVKTGVGRDGEVIDRGLRRTPRGENDDEDDDEDDDDDEEEEKEEDDGGIKGRTRGQGEEEGLVRSKDVEMEQPSMVGGLGSDGGTGSGSDGTRTREGEDEVVGLLKQL